LYLNLNSRYNSNIFTEMVFFEKVVLSILMAVLGFVASYRCSACVLMSLVATMLLLFRIDLSFFIFWGLSVGMCVRK
jgi:hypothetical protein